jgi:hypothetical protein
MKEKIHVLYATDGNGSILPLNVMTFDSAAEAASYVNETFMEIKPEGVAILKGTRLITQIVLKEEENETKTKDC